MPSRSDIGSLAESYKVDLKSHELPQELESRLKREEAEASHQRRKDFFLFVVIISVVAITFLLCLGIIVTPSRNSDDRKWATTILTTIVSAGVGYLTGRGTRSSPG